jgi:hypothetical protein
MATIAPRCRKSPRFLIGINLCGTQRHRDRCGCQALGEAAVGARSPTTDTWKTTRRSRSSQRLPNGKHEALTLGADDSAVVEHHARAPPPVTSADLATMALAQRLDDEMARGSESAGFRLIREILKCIRAPAYVGFCANSTDPDGGKRAPMGFDRSFVPFGRRRSLRWARNCSPDVKLPIAVPSRIEAVAPCWSSTSFGRGEWP